LYPKNRVFDFSVIMNHENRGYDLRVSVPVSNNRPTLVGIGDSRAEAERKKRLTVGMEGKK
jgi:hypothetical protein